MSPLLHWHVGNRLQLPWAPGLYLSSLCKLKVTRPPVLFSLQNILFYIGAKSLKLKDVTKNSDFQQISENLKCGFLSPRPGAESQLSLWS